MKKKICIITGSRAEYGLLRPLMEEIKKQQSFILQVVATGSHLEKEFGYTYKEIENNGFKIDEKVKINLRSDTPDGISKSMGLALIGFGKVFKKIHPDVVIVLGDRFEIFSAVAAAHVSRIPVAHIHGGEITQGAVDDAFRHCITKMSHLHFTSTEEYRKRVIQLGESPETVFNVGAIGIDNIKKMNFLSREVLEEQLGFKFGKRNLLVTFHPVTLENNTAEKQFNSLLEALDELVDTKIIFTKANADADGKIINKKIDEYVAKNTSKSATFTSMGSLKYLSTVRFVDAVVGNSSSGIIEAPSLNVATINIGDRQKGRVMPVSVITCIPVKEDIIKAINKIYSKKHRIVTNSENNPYAVKDTAKNIVRIIKKTDFSNILKKRFYNINYEE